MKIALNAKFSDLLIQIRNKTGLGISQIIYKALEDFANKYGIISE